MPTDEVQSLHPIDFAQFRSTSFAVDHFGEFFAAQALGQHIVLTSLERHIGDASSPNSKAIVSVIIVAAFVVAPVVSNRTPLVLVAPVPLEN
jgi:hypothetical protein